MKTFLTLVALLLITVLGRAQTSYDDVYGDIYTGDSDSIEHPNQSTNVPTPSPELDVPYQEDWDDGDADELIGSITGSGPSPGRISTVSAPPGADMCPPSSSPTKGVVKQAKKQRIKVLFVVILPGFANDTVTQAFDEAQLVAALQKASRARGAQHDFEVRVSSIEYISMRKLMRRRSMLQTSQSLGVNVKVTGEADFAGEDEMVASEIAQLLTDAPSTIFPESDFGSVQVSDATIVEIGGTSWVLPVAGTLGGLTCLAALLSLYMCRGGNVLPTKKLTSDLHDQGFIPEDDEKLRAMAYMSKASNSSQHSLLSSMSSKNYGDRIAPQAAGEKQWNNLGYYQQ